MSRVVFTIGFWPYSGETARGCDVWWAREGVAFLLLSFLNELIRRKKSTGKALQV
jgi:hypothetical protein